jgi:predicted CopG family antitoxin
VVNERNERYVWLEPNVVNRLRAMRRPGESYSDVILRLAAEGKFAQKHEDNNHDKQQ